MKGTGANVCLFDIAAVRPCSVQSAVCGLFSSGPSLSAFPGFTLWLRRSPLAFPCWFLPWFSLRLQTAAFMEQGGPSDRLKHFYEEVRDARRTLHPLTFATKACGQPVKSLTPEAATAILEAAGAFVRDRVPSPSPLPSVPVALQGPPSPPSPVVHLFVCVCAVAGPGKGQPRSVTACSEPWIENWTHGSRRLFLFWLPSSSRGGRRALVPLRCAGTRCSKL
jgi:hypothetical protein